jgi:hypothetical protein
MVGMDILAPSIAVGSIPQQLHMANNGFPYLPQDDGYAGGKKRTPDGGFIGLPAHFLFFLSFLANPASLKRDWHERQEHPAGHLSPDVVGLDAWVPSLQPA